MIRLNIQRFNSTNKTTHYELSQYVSSDLPTYLVDYNSDMSKIDTGINTAQTTADTASTAATNASTAASTAQTTAETAITNAATADGKAVNALNDIGTMANLTTAEKNTLVGAINEVDGDIGNLSSLQTDVATSIVAAINSVEVKVEELDNYSTTESLTGQKWINDKPIYRKVFTFSSLSNSTSNEIGTISGLESIVNIYGMTTLSGDEYTLPHVDYRDKEWNIGAHGNSTTGKIYVDKGGFGTITGQSYVVVEYTKSSN